MACSLGSGVYLNPAAVGCSGVRKLVWSRGLKVFAVECGDFSLKFNFVVLGIRV